MNVVVALAVIVLAAAPRVAEAQTAHNQACQFAIVGAPPERLEVAGPEEILSRLRLVVQRDSPVAITRADFTGSVFEAGQGFARMEKSFAIEIANLSDIVIEEARVTVRVGSARSGFGGGPIFKGSLLPGKSTVLEVRGGGGRHVDPAGPEPEILLWVESVTLDGCIYRPALALPADPQ